MTNAEAIETLRANYPDACFEQLREAVDAAIEALEDSIDYMPVVLCKDCKWWIPHGKETPASIPALGECQFKDRKFGTACWEFCFWGERKDDA